MPGLGGAEYRNKGTWRIGTDFAYKFGKDLWRIDHREANAINVRNVWTKFNTSIDYGLTDRITLSASLPFSMSAREEGYRNNYYTSHGMGDFTVKGTVWITRPDSEGWNVYVAPGLTVPTGSSAEKDTAGRWKLPYIVPGSGQWSPQLSIGLNKGVGTAYGLPRFGFTANGGHLWSLGKNDAGYDAANATFAAVGGSYTALHFGEFKQGFVAVGFALTGIQIKGWDTRNDVKVGNTGGTWLDINPGLVFSPNRGGVTLAVSVAHTVYQKVHSLQTTQPLSYSASMGYRF